MTDSVDIQLFFLINRGTANQLFDILMPLLSNRGFLLALPLLAFAGMSVARSMRGTTHRIALPLVLMPVVAFYIADRVNDLPKLLIARPRPCIALEGVRLLVRCPGSFSMPSGHAVASFAYAVSFWIVCRNVIAPGWRWFVLALAAAIAFSRIYIGVHYPADIAVGTVLGCGIGWGAGILAVRISARICSPGATGNLPRKNDAES